MTARLAFFAMLAFLNLPAESSAAKLLLITRGDGFSDLGPNQGKALPQELMGFKVGYKYSYFGLFWVDVWRGSGEYCLYREKEFIPITKAQAAEHLGVSENEVKEPFFYDLPPGLIVIAALVVLGIGMKIHDNVKKRNVMALVTDPRYSQALDIFREKIQENETAKAAALEKNEAAPALVDPMSAAVDHLVSTGIERSEAEQKFGTVLSYAMQRANEQAANG